MQHAEGHVPRKTPKLQPREAVFRQLPNERRAITHQFWVSGSEWECCLTVGLYEDGTPGEISFKFLECKEGDLLPGLLNAFAFSVSLNLQFGVPLKWLIDKYVGESFGISGWTSNSKIPHAKSITDYAFKWLDATFYPKEEPGSEPTPTFEAPLLPNVLGNCKICGGELMAALDGSGFQCKKCDATTSFPE